MARPRAPRELTSAGSHGSGRDIGAFQSQGFTLTPVAGSTPQSAAVGTAFAKPLAVTVTAINPAEPVDGGVIRFAVPSAGGASATLSAATATIVGGQAAVTATANATPGPYTASATAAGAGPASFALTNAAALQLGADGPRRRGGRGADRPRRRGGRGG